MGFTNAIILTSTDTMGFSDLAEVQIPCHEQNVHYTSIGDLIIVEAVYETPGEYNYAIRSMESAPFVAFWYFLR
ncbi:hypothetical protein [Paenibacillus sp. IHBB 10380]|uniref:hypothetical protein n=1 Tax=Paenibacillus sp. IHBB 10380 TaxID=1566358 RepID=UPI0005CFA40E|nr:hypothetical protein [Paenibacillus sp. IHBB 10380]AJS58927.1 hypothetical protein UB51_11065 [Paenibacillus sp. IHBB 10380]